MTLVFQPRFTRAGSPAAEARRKSLSPMIGKVHQQASAAQTIYHNAVVCWAACLVVAFLALASTTFALRFQKELGRPPVVSVITGLSAAMTAYYINQNSRSLIHRYYTQRRFIKAWLEAFNKTRNFADLPSKVFQRRRKDSHSRRNSQV